MLEDNLDSTTNHLNSSPMFLDCLMLDLTVIDLMPILIWTKFGLKLQKNLKCGRPRGGGSKKGKFLRTSFMDAPLMICSISADKQGLQRISSYT